MTTRKQLLLILTFSAIAAIIFVTSFRAGPSTSHQGYLQPRPPLDHTTTSSPELSPASLTGHAIAPKLGNETAKAELGRAAWKVLHTMMARFPETPTADESDALRSYIHLFQRLYPCGECATHFGEILKEYPPQVSGRNAAAGWACHVHNVVNESLGKQEFDCTKIGEFYDCGCAEDEEGEGKGGEKKAQEEIEKKAKMSEAEVERLTGRRGREIDPYKEVMAQKIEYIKVE